MAIAITASLKVSSRIVSGSFDSPLSGLIMNLSVSWSMFSRLDCFEEPGRGGVATPDSRIVN
jgi:hypothetical protein